MSAHPLPRELIKHRCYGTATGAATATPCVIRPDYR
jgi:hypothetical protein